MFEVGIPTHVTEQIIPDLCDAISQGHGGFASEYLLDELLSKFVGKETDPAHVRRDRAIDKLLGVELLNAKTNDRLMLASIVDQDLGWISYGRLVRRIRAIIHRVLGPLHFEDVFATFSHTNGASTRVKRSSKAALDKLSGEAHVSSSALATWLRAVYDGYPVRHVSAGQDLEIRESSELFTVPKKSDIDRVACKEPEINMLLQRACGVYIRGRLRRVGIDLQDQTINQRLAGRAYRDGLATIDLSSASDTISSMLVQQLLPTDWWALLDDLRVKSTYIPTRKMSHTFEMFSSMGNGFTFELESLLFYAIARAVADMSGFKGAVISVYGDDIIAPSGVVPRLLRILSFFGFKPNRKKTHYRGRFRESCGKHYYGDFDVTPFYIRRPVSSLPDLIRVLNRVMEWDARGWGFMTTPSLAAFHWKYSRYVPAFLWGGVDPAEITALVTGDVPRKRLTPVTKGIYRDDKAGLTHWIMSREQMQPSGVVHTDVVGVGGSSAGGEVNIDGVEVDPTVVVGYKVTRNPRGWHTSWRPWLIFQGPEQT